MPDLRFALGSLIVHRILHSGKSSIKDFVALTPHNEAHFCLVPRIVDQQIILKLQKVMMEIGSSIYDGEKPGESTETNDASGDDNTVIDTDFEETK